MRRRTGCGRMTAGGIEDVAGWCQHTEARCPPDNTRAASSVTSLVQNQLLPALPPDVFPPNAAIDGRSDLRLHVPR